MIRIHPAANSDGKRQVTRWLLGWILAAVLLMWIIAAAPILAISSRDDSGQPIQTSSAVAARVSNDQVPSYTVLKLPEMRGRAFYPELLNDNGQIAGFISPVGVKDPDLNIRACVFDSKSFQVVRTCPLDYFSVAFNNEGDVLLHTPSANGFLGALWTRSGISKIPFDPTGINDRGQVVGYQTTVLATRRHYVGRIWDHGKTTFLPGGRPDIIPFAINNRGEIVGVDNGEATRSANHRGPVVFFLLRSDSWTPIMRIGPESPSATTPIYIARAQITDSGMILVSYQIQQGGHIIAAELWSEGKLTAVSTSGQVMASGVNNTGDVISEIAFNRSNVMHPFVFRNGKLYDLNTLLQNAPGIKIGGARSINNDGEILCFGPWRGGTAWYLLIPEKRQGW
jgi:probable HAF family extracellular repeat protein